MDGISIGRHTYGNPRLEDYGHGGHCYVGSFCSIAPGVRILLGGEHRHDFVSTYPFAERGLGLRTANAMGHTKGNIYIGSDVWIGQDALILSGVTIGDGAVIGAGSVVASDVEPYSIVVGNPARHVKYRFGINQREALLEICWWRWEDEKIFSVVDLITSTDIDRFIREARAMS